MNYKKDSDFDEWNEYKKQTDAADTSTIYFNEREIWWCRVGLNIGLEQNGKGPDFKRPVLVVKKFSRSLFWAIPLSLHYKSGSFFFPLLAESNVFRIACIPQMRLLDIRRFVSKFDMISEQEYGFVLERITSFLK